MRDIDQVRRFCKDKKIVGVSLSDLFDNLSKRHPMTRDSFEVSMLELNKKPALDLKSRCLEYVKNEGDYAYEKYCLEQGFVTKSFWLRATGVKPLDIDSRPTKTLKVKIVPEVIKTQDPYKAIEEKNEDPDKDKKNEFISWQSMEKMLPINWVSMPFSERVDFVKKIKNSKFREVVLGTDSKLKKFFLKSNPNLTPKMKVYVTLFQFPSNRYSEEAKNLLRAFIEILNTYGRANLQFVECTNPDTIEIREVR
jgi:hypothetical protein